MAIKCTIRIQPIKKGRGRHIYPNKDPRRIKSMDDFLDYCKEDDGPVEDIDF